jgi:hypothetical protein
VALIGHLQVANECRAASATLTAASSGPIPKAPGSAGGYLPPPSPHMSVLGGQAEDICSYQAFPILTDAVEKGLEEPSEQ